MPPRPYGQDFTARAEIPVAENRPSTTIQYSPERRKRPERPGGKNETAGEMTEPLTTETRREIFFKLVEEQDAGTAVEQSRNRIAGVYNITVQELRAIEQEGLSEQWPPLS